MKGYLLVFAAVAFWGLNFVIARSVATDIQPATLAFLRWIFAAALLAPVIPLAWRLRHIAMRHARYHVLAAISGIATYHVCIYSSASDIDIYTMPLLASCSGLFVMAANIFMRRPVTPWQLLGSLLALGGLTILLAEGDLATLLRFRIGPGEAWMLAAAALWGMYSVVVRDRPAGPLLASHLTTIIVALPFLAIMAGAEATLAEPVEWDWQLAGILAYLAVFPSIVCYWLWLGATDKLGATKVSAMYYTLPLFTAVEAYFLLGDKLHGYHVVSAAFIITGAILVTTLAPPPGTRPSGPTDGFPAGKGDQAPDLPASSAASR